MQFQKAVLVATKALFAAATSERRSRARWIGTDDDIEEALNVLLPAMLADAPPCFVPAAGVSRPEITGCASAGPEPGDPRQLKLPATEAKPPPRARCACGMFAASDGLCSPCRHIEDLRRPAPPDPSPTPAELAEHDAELARHGVDLNRTVEHRAFVPERDGPALVRAVSAELEKLGALEDAAARDRKRERKRKRRAPTTTL